MAPQADKPAPYMIGKLMIRRADGQKISDINVRKITNAKQLTIVLSKVILPMPDV